MINSQLMMTTTEDDNDIAEQLLRIWKTLLKCLSDSNLSLSNLTLDNVDQAIKVIVKASYLYRMIYAMFFNGIVLQPFEFLVEKQWRRGLIWLKDFGKASNEWLRALTKLNWDISSISLYSIKYLEMKVKTHSHVREEKVIGDVLNNKVYEIWCSILVFR